MAFYQLHDTFNSEDLDLSFADSEVSIASDIEESYMKVKVLGRGAFGEAALYRKTTTNELVVWKEIDLQRATEKERNNALNEVEILSQLDHVNVVAYYNDFFDGSSLFIEMEYANDGCLHQKIVARNGKLFSEGEALCYFSQLVSAVVYIHSFGILHRDIKPLNIFLTKAQIMKLGDFGISKVLEETYGAAETCVGTPYYMSPELVKGEPYDQKSDIWACGCVLFELLTLKKVFQASNQLKLICSILEKDPEEIADIYSEKTRSIVKQSLEKDSTKRPSAQDLSALKLFDNAKEFVRKHSVSTKPTLQHKISSQRSMTSSGEFVPVVATLSSDVFFWGGGKTIPQKIDSFKEGSSGIHVAAGYSHFAVITLEKELYTWANIQGGMEIVGQLGHGSTAMYRTPKKVSFFDSIPVKQVACGEDFTVVLTDTGDVYSCGSDYYGCLGVDNMCGDTALAPVKIDSLCKIQSISCGDSHVVALSESGQVYTWGCGEYGRLGLGNEDDYAVPQLVSLPPRHTSIIEITCGRDNTLILSSNGQLLGFGSNEKNKMALNQLIHFKSKAQTEEDFVYYVLEPTPIRSLRSYRLCYIAAGKTHSAAIDEFGRLLTFGSNQYGQLGVGNNKHKSSPCLVRGELAGKHVVLCSCGDGFTVAATKDNHLYSWGNVSNGRLGSENTGRKMVCSPKPIFGSLHKVASLSSKHWNTIILAEKVLSSKIIHTKLLSVDEESNKLIVKGQAKDKLKNTQSESFNFDDNVFKGHDSKPPAMDAVPEYGNGDDTGGNSMPPWLADEFENAEYIPMDNEIKQNENNNEEDDSDQSDKEDMPPWLVDEIENAEYIPMHTNGEAYEGEEEVFKNIKENETSFRSTYRKVKHSTTNLPCQECIKRTPSVLELRVQELELQNLKLQRTVEEQELIIETLRKERDCYKKYAENIEEISGSLEINF